MVASHQDIECGTKRLQLKPDLVGYEPDRLTNSTMRSSSRGSLDRVAAPSDEHDLEFPRSSTHDSWACSVCSEGLALATRCTYLRNWGVGSTIMSYLEANARHGGAYS